MLTPPPAVAAASREGRGGPARRWPPMGKKGCAHKRNREKDRAAGIFDRELERFLSGKRWNNDCFAG